MKELGHHERAKRLALESAREIRERDQRELAEEVASSMSEEYPVEGSGWKFVRAV